MIKDDEDVNNSDEGEEEEKAEEKESYSNKDKDIDCKPIIVDKRKSRKRRSGARGKADHERDYLEDEEVLSGKKTQEVYQEVDKTKKYAEMQYYNVKDRKQDLNLVRPNHFWIDYLSYLVSENRQKPFVTVNFKYATNSYTELIAALSVIDIPFAQGLHEYKKSDNGLDIVAGDSMLVYHKEIMEAEKVE